MAADCYKRFMKQSTNIIWYGGVWYGVLYDMIYDIVSWYDMIWNRIIWYRITSFHIISYHMGMNCRTSFLGYGLSWVRVVLGTSCPGYELSWVRVVQIPVISTWYWALCYDCSNVRCVICVFLIYISCSLLTKLVCSFVGYSIKVCAESLYLCGMLSFVLCAMYVSVLEGGNKWMWV